MSKITRSARGEAIDFDLLAIKQQLATTPIPVNVDARRRFIDEKNGIKSKVDSISTPPLLTPEEIKKMFSPTEAEATKDAVAVPKSK